jgi:hypothetical protein
MRYHKTRLLPATLSLLVTLPLIGCAKSPGKLSVDLGAIKECQRLGGPVAVPQIRNSDYRVLSARALGQIKKANDGAEQRTSCEDEVVEKYAKAAAE